MTEHGFASCNVHILPLSINKIEIMNIIMLWLFWHKDVTSLIKLECIICSLYLLEIKDKGNQCSKAETYVTSVLKEDIIPEMNY